MIPYFDAHPNQAAAILVTAMAAIGTLLIRKMSKAVNCAHDTAETRGAFDPLACCGEPRHYDPATDVRHSNIGPGVE